MRVSEIMSPSVIKVTPEDSVMEASRLLSRHNIGALPVCSLDGRIRGIVTDRDIVIRCVASEADPEQTSIREIMTRAVLGVSPEADVREAARIMSTEQVRRLPVLTGGKVVGMLSLGDVAKNPSFDMEASKALSEISTSKRQHMQK